MSITKRKIPLDFGPLDVDAINRALDLELDASNVIMSIRAQNHAQRKHPADYAQCFPHITFVISNPLYVRDDFKNKNKVELISKPYALGGWLLVAVEITIDRNGHYNVTSFYPISDKKVESRKAKGHYKILISK